MKKNKGIRQKILISYLLLVLFALSALGAGIYFPMEKYFLENLEKDMINQAYITRTAVSQEIEEKNYTQLQSMIEKISLEPYRSKTGRIGKSQEQSRNYQGISGRNGG